MGICFRLHFVCLVNCAWKGCLLPNTEREIENLIHGLDIQYHWLSSHDAQHGICGENRNRDLCTLSS